MSRFKNDLYGLGFASYGDYLASDHWQNFRERYRAAGKSMRCAVCARGPIQLHHHTYERLGKEELGDVTPLCRLHHEAVHEWLKARKKFVGSTTEALTALTGAKQRHKKPKVKTNAKKLARKKYHEEALSGNPQYAALYAEWRALAAQYPKWDRPNCYGFLKVQKAIENIKTLAARAIQRKQPKPPKPTKEQTKEANRIKEAARREHEMKAVLYRRSKRLGIPLSVLKAQLLRQPQQDKPEPCSTPRAKGLVLCRRPDRRP